MSQTTKRIHSEDESAEQWRLSKENYWRCLDFSTNSPSSPDPDGGVTCMNSNVRATCKKIKKIKMRSATMETNHTHPHLSVFMRLTTCVIFAHRESTAGMQLQRGFRMGYA